MGLHKTGLQKTSLQRTGLRNPQHGFPEDRFSGIRELIPIKCCNPEVFKTHPRKSTKRARARSMWWLSGRAFRRRESQSQESGGSIWWLSGLGSKSRQNQSHKSIWWFSGLGSEVDKTSPTRLELMTFQPRPRNRWNESQEARFDDFLALAPEDRKTNPRKLDLITFWPGLQESTKPVPWRLDLLTFWPWLQKSTKRWENHRNIRKLIGNIQNKLWQFVGHLWWKCI